MSRAGPWADPAPAGGMSLLDRCGPLSLIMVACLLMIGGLAQHTLPQALVGCGLGFVLVPALSGRWRFPVLRLLPGIIGAVTIGWSNWLLGDPRSLETAALAGLRVAFFVLPGIVLMSYVDPSTLGDHLTQRLRLPDRPVVAFTAAMHRAEGFGEQWRTLAATRRARGLGPSAGPVGHIRHWGALTFGLLVAAVRQAGRMTVAMEARGYSAGVRGGVRRTWSHPARWRPADTGLVLVGLFWTVSPLVAWPLTSLLTAAPH